MITHLLTISSADRDNNSSVSSTDFTINLLDTITGVHKVRFNYCMIPAVSYNINTSNNVVTFYENSTTKTASITVGTYTATSLATEIQTVMNTASGGYNTYTVSYSSTTYKMTFTATNSFSLTCSAAKFPYLQLGFTNSDTSAATSVTSSQAVNLDQPTEYVISINQFDKQIYSSNRSRFGGTFSIPNDVPFGTILNYRPPQKLDLEFENGESFNSLRIKLLDIHGNTINLNNCDWSLSMIVFSGKRKINV